MRQRKMPKQREPLKRREPSPEQGLTNAEVVERMEKGYGNQAVEPLTKTTGQIIRDNVCTFFNFFFLILAGCLFAVGAYTDMMFMGIVVLNVLIGIVQEMRVKRILDRISLVSGRKVTAVRGGRQVPLAPEELVLDDVVCLGPGSPVPADAVVCQGCVEVNEALLTGEADPVRRREGETLLSGSFLVAGHCRARLDRVGGDAYAASLTQAMKKRKRVRSRMMRDLDRLLQVAGAVLVPLGLLMVGKQAGLLGLELPYVVRSTVAALVGMIPEGLYLLVSVALAVSVIRLARRRTLVHQLSCIENLARVDVLCLDKTGTITEGSMEVKRLIPLEPEEGFLPDLRQFIQRMDGENSTAQALKAWAAAGSLSRPRERFPAQTENFSAPSEDFPAPPAPVARQVPFSSRRKWSGQVLADGTVYVLGAPEMLLGKELDRYGEEVAGLFRQGRRVLLFARGRNCLAKDRIAGPLTPLGFLVLSDRIRPQAAETLAYFRRQGVTVKVISGDNGAAAARIAREAGLAGADRFCDLSGLPPEADLGEWAEGYSVFGRVTPEQKQQLVQALQKKGHTVAMIGDGVNDVLALKEADCSIAMASGSEAASQVAQLVLLDSDFSVMPEIVREGRRVINNIQRSASLFCVKNIFSFLVAVILLFAAIPYPLLPAQITLISGFLIGVPSFLLTFEPSLERVQGGFLRNIFLNSLPGGLANVLILLAALFLGTRAGIPLDELSTVCVMLIGLVEILVLLFLCWPLKLWRLLLIAGCGAGFLMAAFWLGPLIHLTALSAGALRLLAILALAVPPLLACLVFGVSRVKKGILLRKRKEKACPAS